MNTTDTTKVDDKILDRVRKLYAMSQDDSSMAEAEIALRRVTSLMKKYGLKAEDLEVSPFNEGCAIQGKSIPKWFKYLSLGIAEFSDCICEGKRNYDGVATFEYKGYDIDVQSALMLQQYLVDTMNRMWEEWKKTADYTGKSASTSFKNGFASTMQERLMDMAHQRLIDEEKMMNSVENSDGKALTVLKMEMVTEKFGKQRISRQRSRVSDGGATQAGSDSARRVGLNKQVTGSGTLQLT